ncbi:hypothetical protein MLD38_039654 [Melastoma candidum]|uniref:Uncharacterized protein n=1 Tax=Melastoma candidum TaxID=119954 RepID=A0ACB9L3H5_9MYRT|nr:hypothetical protein MLD38_039654 [Melastoma candidum]
MGKVLAQGHSRVPVCSGPQGMSSVFCWLRVFLLCEPKQRPRLALFPSEEFPGLLGIVFGRVPADMPLYDILNEFQKGCSHMRPVVKSRGKARNFPSALDTDKIKDDVLSRVTTDLTTPLLSMPEEKLRKCGT